jgi:hypothetical protein
VVNRRGVTARDRHGARLAGWQHAAANAPLDGVDLVRDIDH